MKRFSYFAISFLVILLDQISKIIIRNTIEPDEIVRVTNKLFWLTNIQNTGAAFSLFASDSKITLYLLIFITIIAIAVLTYLILRTVIPTEKVVYALILGGAAGNLIDRIMFGKVTDFIWVDFPDAIMQRWPVFNLADSSIVIAITLMLIYTIFFARNPVEEQ